MAWHKGTPNKLTASAREAIELAFEGLGGLAALTEWAKIHRTVFYARIWPKLLPLQIGAEQSERVQEARGVYDC